VEKHYYQPLVGGLHPYLFFLESGLYRSPQRTQIKTAVAKVRQTRSAKKPELNIDG
jgi:hypothetical protein